MKRDAELIWSGDWAPSARAKTRFIDSYVVNWAVRQTPPQDAHFDRRLGEDLAALASCEAGIAHLDHV